MGDVSALQTSFLGGEIGPYFQGRADDPRYKIGMNVCLNTIPVEEGAAVRRSGTAFAATTRNGAKAITLDFHFQAANPYSVEFTDGFIRFFSGTQLVTDASPPTVSSISTASPAVVRTSSPHGWSTGDQVQFSMVAGVKTYLGMVLLLTRQFSITVVDAFTFSLADPITGLGVSGAAMVIQPGTLVVSRVTTIVTPYVNGAWENARLVQNSTTAFVLVPGYPPYILTSVTPPGNTFATFTFAEAAFLDGPYLDPPSDGSTVTPGATSGTITLTWSSIANVNGGAGFTSADIGRPVRLFSEPAAYASGTAYTAGQSVKYGGYYYTCILAGTGKEPDTHPGYWSISATAANWTWGNITAVSSTNVVSILVATATVDASGTPRADGPLLQTVPVVSWQLGAWSVATGYPTCGTYYEGRFWLTGAIANRFDTTESNDTFRMSPTGQDGTVADNSGISETMNSEEIEIAYWMLPTSVGVLIGTQTGEWLVQASSLQDPITPTSIQAHRNTKFGSVNTPAVQTGSSIVFPTRYGRKLIEYTANLYSGKYFGTNISVTAKHLALSGVAQLVFVRETVPCLWARCNDGTLIGCSYKFEIPFGTQPIIFSGWHRHALGSGRLVESLQAGPSIGGDIDALTMVTNDPATNVRFVELLTDLFGEDATIYNAWYVDEGIIPGYVQNNGTGVQLWGFWPLIGKTITAFLGGLDCGDYVVQADGSITVPYSADPDMLFTKSYLDALSATGANFAPMAGTLQTVTTTTPAAPGAPAYVMQYYDSTYTQPSFGYLEAIDWANNRVFLAETTTGTTGLVRKNLANNNTTASNTFTAGSGEPFQMLTYGNGFLYTIDGSANASELFEISATSLAGTRTYSSDGSDASPPHLPTPSDAIVLVGAGSSYYVAASIVQENITILELSQASIGYAGRTPIVPGSAFSVGSRLCKGYSGADSAQALVIANPNVSSGSLQIGLSILNIWAAATLRSYSGVADYASGTTYAAAAQVLYLGIIYTSLQGSNLGNTPSTSPLYWQSNGYPGMALELVKLYSPADIDATWTNFDTVGNGCAADVAYDATDNTAIMCFTTPDSVTHKYYLVKLSLGDGSVVWKTAIATPLVVNRDSRIQHQRINLFSGATNLFYFVNTATGAISSVSVTGLSASNVLTSDDVSGLIFMQAGYTQAGGTPAPNPAASPATPTSYGSASWMSFPGGTGPTTVVTTDTVPLILGLNYTSEGQLLRALGPQESGSQSGPSLGMTRRSHMFGALLVNSQGMNFGTNLSGTMFPANFQVKKDVGPVIPKNQLFSGVWYNTIDGDYNFDDMLAWSVTRPYPANVLAFGAFRHTQDR